MKDIRLDQDSLDLFWLPHDINITFNAFRQCTNANIYCHMLGHVCGLIFRYRELQEKYKEKENVV